MAQVMMDSDSKPKSIPILGVGRKGIGSNGELPLRRELDEWWFSRDQNDLNQQSLFIYALHAFQARGLDPDKSDPLSWVSVGGIHGLPLKSWPEDNPNKSKAWWYCAHRQVTFATWHTPYMLLFEQRVYEEMCGIIESQFSGEEQLREEMQRAADSWRLPFWDWARRRPDYRRNPSDNQNVDRLEPVDGPNIPYLLTVDEIEVRTATGTTKVPNPMVAFAVSSEGRSRNFGDFGISYPEGMVDPNGNKIESPWIPTCQRTSKWPKGLDDVEDDATWDEVSEEDKKAYAAGQFQDLEKITQCLQGAFQTRQAGEKHQDDLLLQNGLPEAVLRLFTPAQDDPARSGMTYRQFSTKKFITRSDDDRDAGLSLEFVHDNMHGWIGGGGYMGDPSTAGFDPIFWMHHCNVDRLLAIWQTLFPEDYKIWLDTPAGQEQGNSQQPLNDDSSTELLPFCTDEAWTPYTSKTASGKFEDWGYTYPELQRWNYSSDEEFFESIRSSLSMLYSGLTFATLGLQSTAVQKRVNRLVNADDTINAYMPFGVQKEIEDTPTEDSPWTVAAEVEWSNDDYVVQVIYNSFELGGRSFGIVIYLGDVPGDNIFSFANDTALGEVYNFASPAEGRGAEAGCANCAAHQATGILVSGQVILTGALLKLLANGSLADFNEETIVAYLKKNLHWRIRTRLGGIIEPERLTSLTVRVTTSKATHYAAKGKHTTYSNYRELDTAPASDESDGQTGQRVASR